MTIDLLHDSELPKLWQWIQDEPQWHMDDVGPKTLEAFTTSLEAQGITLFAVRTGKKLVGAIGFKPANTMLRGVHFIQEVRGTGLPRKALHAVLLTLFSLGLEKVSFLYFGTNTRAHKFFLKAGATFDGVDGSTNQNGQIVPLFKAAFHADTLPAHL